MSAQIMASRLPLRPVWAFTQICLALSLISDSHVEPGIFWNDYHELSGIVSVPRSQYLVVPQFALQQTTTFWDNQEVWSSTEGDTVVLPQGKDCKDRVYRRIRRWHISGYAVRCGDPLCMNSPEYSLSVAFRTLRCDPHGWPIGKPSGTTSRTAGTTMSFVNSAEAPYP